VLNLVVESPVDENDLSVQSDYNTYLITGCRLHLYQIRIYLQFEQPKTPTNLIFVFRAKCDNSGTHIFAQTLQEQMRMPVDKKRRFWMKTSSFV